MSDFPQQLISAARNGQEIEVELLLAKGVNIEVADERGSTALHLAASNGHEKVVELLLSKGPKIEAVDKRGSTALHLAAADGHEKVVDLLLSKGANINAADKRGSTALHSAASNGHDKVVDLLFSKGANIEAASEYGSTALQKAAENGHERVVELLLSKGANIEATNGSGSTALHSAASYGHEKVVELLLSKGVNIEATDENDTRALHMAAESGHEKVVELLLLKGANINAADKVGRTALILAVLKENVKAALVLISNGADVKKIDEHKKNALDYATERNLVMLTGLLSKPETAKYVASKLLLESNAVNDSSRFGIDRLGVSPYAKAIYNVLSSADTPLCVGLFGRWGSGKSFLIQLIKYNFDKSVSLHPYSNELLQWYEEKWINPLKSDTNSRVFSDGSLIDCFTLRAMCCGYAILWPVFGCVAIIAGESSRYLIKLVVKLLYDELRYLSCSLCGNIFRFTWEAAMFCCTGLDIYHPFESHNDDDIENQEEMNKSQEYVFVDFNAWEYSQSDELWAGLIRNIYTKVELRFEQHCSPKHRSAMIRWSAKSQRRDWKETWRLQKAEKILTKNYGGSIYLHARLWIIAAGSIFMIYFIFKTGIISLAYHKYFDLLEIMHPTQQQPINSITSFNQTSFNKTTLQPFTNETKLTFEDVRSGFSIILSVLAIIAGAVPISSFLSYLNQTVNSSRGDVIFEEAKGVKDEIGFLSRVRGELQELFDFMKHYEHETKIKLHLVVFVDDLDRCLEGRNVKCLEAIQLILAIPGAPVICFLAIDPQVLVASIEKTINNSLAIEDALISGWEYLDKIVQIPFCLPDPPPEKVRRYVESCLTQPYDARIIFQMLTAIVEKVKSLVETNTQGEGVHTVKFLVKSLSNNGKHISYKTFHDLLVSSKKSSAFVDLILALAPLLLEKGEFYKLLYQNSLKQKESISCGLNTNAIVELMCRELFDILQTVKLDSGNIDFSRIITPTNNTVEQRIPIGNETMFENPTHKNGLPFFEIAERFRNGILDRFMKLEPDSQLPKGMCHTFLSLCERAESNPRRFKRILNVVAIAYQVALCKPISEDSLELTVAVDDRWSLFSLKITKWIFLNELYPYRMSFLVQMLKSYNQKEAFNKELQSRNNGIGIQYVNKAFITAEETMDEKFLSRDIAEFYYEHVEKYIYAISSAEKLLRLDSDAEQFALLMFSLLSYDDDSVAHNICCRDVLGVDSVTGTTNASFSLLSYSFNLNPSMSKQIGIELQELITGYELGISTKRNVISNDENKYSSFLLRDGIIAQKKKRIVQGEEDEKKRIVHGEDQKKRNIHGEVDENTPLLSAARSGRTYSSRTTASFSD